MSNSVTTMWDSRAVKKGISRVMLCVLINRERFMLSIKVYCSKVDYDKAVSGRSLSPVQKVLRQDLFSFVLKAENLLERLHEPTKETFLRFFKSNANLSVSSKTDCYEMFKVRFDTMMSEGRFGTAHSFRCSWYSLRLFKKELYLEDIDERFLKSYTSYMLKKGATMTTVGVYLGKLRVIYNQAVTDGLIAGHAKPFKNVMINSSAKSKGVLYPVQLKALWEYRSDSVREQRAVAFFFFCYLANGMNFKDVGHLKFRNIQGETLTYVREKTKRTKNNNAAIKVHVHPAMKKIIDVWGNKVKHPDAYIFPLMSKYRSAKHMDDTIVRYKRVSNKMLSEIGKGLGFDVHLCLNLARHSFATKQKIDGVNPHYIKDAMGHSSLQVTEHYLKSLPDENLANLTVNLLNFGSNKTAQGKG